MNVLFLYASLRMNGISFLRSRYFVEDLEARGHTVRLAYFIVDNKNEYTTLQDDAITFKEVAKFQPDAIIFELGSADRFPKRAWLDQLKRRGCIVLHCGLDYNVYNQNRARYDEMYAGFGCGIRKKRGDESSQEESNHEELPIIREANTWNQVTVTDGATLRDFCCVRKPKIFENVPWVSSHSALVVYPCNNVLLTGGHRSFVKAYDDEIHGDANAIYGAFGDANGIEVLITGHFVTDGDARENREHNRTFLINVLEHFEAFNPTTYRRGTNKRANRAVESLNTEGTKMDNVISILFLAADPTDASRLRLAEEFREIHEKIKLAKLRPHFKLELPQLSLRPPDISQALLDTQPQIVHFSGHGMANGALCFENASGQTQPIQPEALAALLEQFAHQVNCVLLNACFSVVQAQAIAQHIEYVIGMNEAIGDKAAIAFAVGFYQALGAGRTIEEAYKLGCVQIRLQGIAEHLTPALIKKTALKGTG